MTEASMRRLVSTLEKETGLPRIELWALVVRFQNSKQVRRVLVQGILGAPVIGKRGRPRKPTGFIDVCTGCLRRRQKDRLRKFKRQLVVATP